MSLTDRFIKVPISIYDIEFKEVTGKEDLEMSWMKFNPMDLSCYRPSSSKNKPDEELVSMMLKNGDSSLVYLTIKEFEDLLNKF